MRTRLARITYRDQPADVAGYLATFPNGRERRRLGLPIKAVSHGQKASR